MGIVSEVLAVAVETRVYDVQTWLGDSTGLEDSSVPVNCFVQEGRSCLFKGKQKQELASTENDVIS